MKRGLGLQPLLDSPTGDDPPPVPIFAKFWIFAAVRPVPAVANVVPAQRLHLDEMQFSCPVGVKPWSECPLIEGDGSFGTVTAEAPP